MEHRRDLESILLDGLSEADRENTVEFIRLADAAELDRLRNTDSHPPVVFADAVAGQQRRTQHSNPTRAR